MEPTLAYSDKLALDAQGNVAVDLPCVRCGYNLRGLSPDGACPECGTAVGRSALGDYLRFSDPTWVGTLASGMNLIVVAIVVGFIFGLCAAVLISMRILTPTLIQIVAMGIGVISLIGYWKVTTPDPGQLELDSPSSSRILVRVTQVTAFVLAVGKASLAHFSPLLVGAVAILQQIVGLVNFFAVFTYARTLALRVPDQQLASQTRVVMWGLVVSMVLCIVAAASVLFLLVPRPQAGGPPGFRGMAVFAIIGGLFIFVFAIWSLLLIDRYRRRFKQAAREATETWAAVAQPAVATL